MSSSAAALPVDASQVPLQITPALRQRLDLLHHLVEFGRQVIVVNGTRGSGRSRLLQAAATEAGPLWQVIAASGATHSGASALLEVLAGTLALEDPQGKPEELREHLAQLEHHGRLGVLMLDDADTLDDAACALLFELAHSSDERGDLRVVMATDADLDFCDRLQAAAPQTALVHVVDVPPMDAEDLKILALHVLEAEGGGDSPDAGIELDAVIAASGGNPGELLAGLRREPPPQRSLAAVMTRVMSALAVRKYVAAAAAAAFVLVAVTVGGLLITQHAEPSKPGMVEVTLPPPADKSPTAAIVESVPPTPAPAIAGPAPEAPATVPASSPPRPAAIAQPAVPAIATPHALPPLPPAKPAPARAVAETAAPSKSYSAHWLQSQKAKSFVLQLFGGREREAALNFIRAHELGEKATVVQTVRDHAPWYVVVAGLYPTRAAANAAIKALSPALAKAKPWPRTVASLHP